MAGRLGFEPLPSFLRLHLRVLFFLFREAPHPLWGFPFPEADSDKSAHQKGGLGQEAPQRLIRR